MLEPFDNSHAFIFMEKANFLLMLTITTA